MKNKIAQSRRVVPTNSNVNPVVVFHRASVAIKRMIAEIIPMNLNVVMSRVLHHNSHVLTDGVFQICGNVSRESPFLRYIIALLKEFLFYFR